MRGRVLIVAGSDCSGGAGIQADIKTVTALGGYAMTAVTALTAQNTTGVHDIYPVPPAFVAQQMTLCLDDIGADVIKTGMLGDALVVAAVADVIERLPPTVLVVVDPVMIAKGGTALLAVDATAVLLARLLPRATVLTPNVPEAEIMLGRSITDVTAMRTAAMDLLGMGPAAVLLKGGHLEGGETVVDVLATPAGISEFCGPRLSVSGTHGTGCTLASAVAVGLAQGMTLVDAVGRGRWYVVRAMVTAPGFGHGHGPLNHGHVLQTSKIFSAREDF